MSETDMLIRSRPVYQPLTFDVKGRFNVMIGFGVGASAIEGLVKSAGDRLKVENTAILISGDESQQHDASLIFAEKSYQQVTCFANAEAIMAFLPSLLKGMVMGMRMYIAGPEAAIWQTVQLAKDNGVINEEIAVEARGSFARRVTCTHCTETTSNVTTNIYTCTGCGLTLLVYDHFSRLLSAYMGFRVDAEIPGDLPEKVEMYR